MRAIVLALALAVAPMTLAGDSGSDMNTFVLKDGTTTRVSGSTDELDQFETKMREIVWPARFTRIADAAKLDAEKRSIEERREKHEAIRTGKAL